MVVDRALLILAACSFAGCLVDGSGALLGRWTRPVGPDPALGVASQEVWVEFRDDGTVLEWDRLTYELGSSFPGCTFERKHLGRYEASATSHTLDVDWQSGTMAVTGCVEPSMNGEHAVPPEDIAVMNAETNDKDGFADRVFELRGGDLVLTAGKTERVWNKVR
ncbi:MAG: hypothetical protein U0271_20525 [Polyangiaceae bacterium]